MEVLSDNVFTAKPIPNGYSYTVTNIWPQLLSQAELLYGPRDLRYTILGIELTEEEQPQTWYPYPNCISIQITRECLHDFNRAIFQISHEIVHCLCPKPGSHASILEEGLASKFSEEISLQYGSTYKVETRSYQFAMEKAKMLIAYDSEIIKKARQKSIDISSFTAEQLKSICPKLDDALLHILLSPFRDVSFYIDQR